MKVTVSKQKKSSEKLSSGLSINRAGDNASGLAVSEKIRSQIRGLSKATDNANDGISLIQTADGGLNETHAVLQRMRELAVQASNGTYTDEDREAIQLEVDALKSEIDRISQSTEFNNIKLLDGSLNIQVNSEVKSNEYGALYGSVNYGLDIGGGKITVTSSIRDMYLEFTTGASGAGGENAVWKYDLQRTDGDLTQHVLINLAEGCSYTDKQIQDLINNACLPKNFEAAPGKITFSSEYGIIQAANCETYGIVTGNLRQITGVDTKSLGKQSDVRYEVWKRDGSKNLSVVWEDSAADSITVDPDGTIHLLKGVDHSESEIVSALATCDAFKNDNVKQDGSAADADGYMDDLKINSSAFQGGALKSDSTSITVSYKENYEQEITEHYQYYQFLLSANQYGSYAECIADEEKYRQPDCIDDFNRKALSGVEIQVSDSADDDIACEINGDKLTVTLKKGYESSSPADIASEMQNCLDSNGYNYTVQTSICNENNATPDGKNVLVKRFIADSGSQAGNIIVEGSRSVKRVGTVAGVRQELSGSLLSLVGSGSVTGSSDYIRITATTYGRSSDYESLVGRFNIVTDAGEGEESVEVRDGLAYIHLSTGVRYSEATLQNMIEQAGLSYEVTLTDRVNPDGDEDGYVFFTKSGSVGISQEFAGQGVGIEDISTITEGLTFQIGANGNEDQQVTMKIADAGSAALGVSDIDVSTVDKANKSISLVDKAIKQVSMKRANLGALQNRLEHTVNNLVVSGENLLAAESQIRDTDIAAEMIGFTKQNILSQASQAMLAQANSQVQQIVQLLQ